MRKVKILIETNSAFRSKLMMIKLIKTYCYLGLKEAKELFDKNIEYNGKLNIEVDADNVKDVVYELKNIDGVKIKVNDRERKLKRILYSENKNLLLKDMLNDVYNWQNSDILTDEDKNDLSFKECRDKVIENIFNKYEEYLEEETFFNIFNDIGSLSDKELKSTELQFLKLNEEIGELSSEYLKYKGHSIKNFDRDNLIGEMADSLQVLLSIYYRVGNEVGISIDEVLEKIKEKNVKWENCINNILKNETK